MLNASFYFLLSWFSVLIINVYSVEYTIKDGAIPSYLYWVQRINASDNIIIMDIIVNVSMSRVTGTLLYAFDRNLNQLIVTMRDGLPHVMDIELNTQRVSVSLLSICGCDRCTYEALELRIQIGYYIRVQCNGRDVKMFKNEYMKGINEHYPILHSTKKRSTDLDHSDYVWLVNTPRYGNVYPNMYQMYGCIFNVSFNEESTQFTEVTPNIDNKCIKTCTDNICNGGQCYETYGDAPICNCTSTFMNGPYCNDSIAPLNIRTIDKRFQCDGIKLSWKSSVDKIFRFANRDVRISLERKESSLVLNYQSRRNKRYSRVTISDNYVPNKEYICILYFQNGYIDIMLYNDGSWSNRIIPVNVDLSKVVFDSILLRSEDGIIEMAYKDIEEYNWHKLSIQKYEDIKYNTNTASTSFITKITTTTESFSQSKTIWLLSIFLALSIVISIILMIFLLRRSTRKCHINTDGDFRPMIPEIHEKRKPA